MGKYNFHAEIISNKEENPVTRTEYIMHKDKWLDEVVEEIVEKNEALPFVTGLEKFERVMEIEPYGELNTTYGEGATYDTKRNYIVIAGNRFTNRTTDLAIVDTNGVTVASRNISSTNEDAQCCAYNKNLDVIYISFRTHILIINAQTYAEEGTLQIPDEVYGYCLDYDNKNNMYVFYILSEGRCYFKLYDQNMQSIESYEFDIIHSARQGFCYANNKAWIATWKYIAEIDLKIGTITYYYCNSTEEVEDLFYNDESLYMFSHTAGVNGIEHIYRYNSVISDYTLSYENVIDKAIEKNGVNLNNLQECGNFYCESGSAELNFPNNETKGYVHNIAMGLINDVDLRYKKIYQTFISSDSSNVYHRYYDRGWSPWKTNGNVNITWNDNLTQTIIDGWNSFPRNTAFTVSIASKGTHYCSGYISSDGMYGVVYAWSYLDDWIRTIRRYNGEYTQSRIKTIESSTKRFQISYSIPANGQFNTSLQNAGVVPDAGKTFKAIVGYRTNNTGVIPVAIDILGAGDYAIQLINIKDSQISGTMELRVLQD